MAKAKKKGGSKAKAARKVKRATSARKSPRKHKRAVKRYRKIGQTSVKVGTRKGKARRKKVSIYARNPISGKGLMGMAIPAVLGAVGAIAINEAMKRMTFLPVSFTSGYVNYLTRAGIAIGAGMALEKFKVLDPAKRNALIGGALVVTAYDALMEVGAKQGWFAPAMNGYEYINGYQTLENMNGLGYVNSAPIAGTMPAAFARTST